MMNTSTTIPAAIAAPIPAPAAAYQFHPSRAIRRKKSMAAAEPNAVCAKLMMRLAR
jgi:hypothetical protein